MMINHFEISCAFAELGKMESKVIGPMAEMFLSIKKLDEFIAIVCAKEIIQTRTKYPLLNRISNKFHYRRC